MCGCLPASRELGLPNGIVVGCIKAANSEELDTSVGTQTTKDGEKSVVN